METPLGGAVELEADASMYSDEDQQSGQSDARNVTRRVLENCQVLREKLEIPFQF